MDSAGALSLQAILPLTLAAIVVMLAGCGVGCLYGETGKVTVIRAASPPNPERVVEVVAEALQPMGFSGREAGKLTPRPPWYWDYEFSMGAGVPREQIDIHIKFDDLSISLSDFARNSKASAFDRSVTEAIKTRLRSDLDADIVFTHPRTPAFCLGP